MRPAVTPENHPDCPRGDRYLLLCQPEGDGLAVAERAATRTRADTTARRCHQWRAARSFWRRSRSRSARSMTPPSAPSRGPSRARPTTRCRRSCRTPISAGTPRAGPITTTGAQDVLSLATGLTGTINVTGSLSSKATSAVSALGSLLGDKAAKQIAGINIKSLNANADIKGSVTITSRPKLAAAWHFEPNFGAQVNLGDTLAFGRRRTRQRAGRGQAGDRQDRERSARGGGGSNPQGPGAGTERQAAMGENVPLHSTANRRHFALAAAHFGSS